MSLEIFTWSVIAGIVATVIVGGSVIYKNKRNFKAKDTIIQNGNDNNAIHKSRRVKQGREDE